MKNTLAMSGLERDAETGPGTAGGGPGAPAWGTASRDEVSRWSGEASASPGGWRYARVMVDVDEVYLARQRSDHRWVYLEGPWKGRAVPHPPGPHWEFLKSGEASAER